jgi:hypothetical protein
MRLWCERIAIRRRRREGSSAVGAGIQEGKLRSASIEYKPALTTLMVFLVLSPFTATAQNPVAPAQPGATASQSVAGQLPKLWYSEASHKDFRVEIKGDVFRADWINLPAAAAKDGASIRIECRRTGTKWVGSSSVYQPFADPSAAAGKDTRKMCHLSTRFEVDSIGPEKIAFHTEALRRFDYSKCQVLQTAWEAFAWVPKK